MFTKMHTFYCDEKHNIKLVILNILSVWFTLIISKQISGHFHLTEVKFHVHEASALFPKPLVNTTPCLTIYINHG